jgi:hypothetical protein
MRANKNGPPPPEDRIQRSDNLVQALQANGADVWGDRDTEAPGEIAATALNLSLSALGNIRTESLRAFSAEEMGKIVAKLI